MKKAFLIIIAMIAISSVHAQTPKELVAKYKNKKIYILFNLKITDDNYTQFTDASNGEICYEGVLYYANSGKFEIIKLNKQKPGYDIYGFLFNYFNHHKPDPQITYKPESYLETLKSKGMLVDWDEYVKTHTDREEIDLINLFRYYGSIYFINRYDTKHGIVKIHKVTTARDGHTNEINKIYEWLK